MFARAVPCSAYFIVAFLLTIFSSLAHADDAINVHVEEKGGMIIVNAQFVVRANRITTWQVLTDFNRMPQFLTGLERSKVISRKGNVWRIAQQGAASVGLLSFAYDSVRDIYLKPTTEIRAYTIGGSMKKMDSVTQLITDRGTTRVIYRAEMIPGTALPLGLVIGFIEDRTRQQFGEMRQEILRRVATGYNSRSPA